MRGLKTVGALIAVKLALEWVLGELRNDPRVTEDARKIRKVRRQDLEELSACYRS